jgi:hypothetical protein
MHKSSLKTSITYNNHQLNSQWKLNFALIKLTDIIVVIHINQLAIVKLNRLRWMLTHEMNSPSSSEISMTSDGVFKISVSLIDSSTSAKMHWNQKETSIHNRLRERERMREREIEREIQLFRLHQFRLTNTPILKSHSSLCIPNTHTHTHTHTASTLDESIILKYLNQVKHAYTQRSYQNFYLHN